MAEYKGTLIMSFTTVPGAGTTTNARSASWTEQFYLSVASDALARVKMNDLGLARARLLPVTGRVSGYRLTNLANPGLGLAGNILGPGASGLKCDIPQMSLLCDATAGTGARRSIILRGLPDARAEGGEWVPARAYENALEDFFNVLKSGFGITGIDRAQELLSISSISNAGLVTTVMNHPYAVGDKVKFFRTRDAYKQTVKGTWLVQAPITATTFLLVGWGVAGGVTYGAVNAGKVRRVGKAFSAFTSIEMDRVVARAVGRPLNPYVGRR